MSILQQAAPFGPRSFGRFLVVGGVNTVVGLSSFPALYLALGGALGYLPILVFCAVFNPAFSFLTHKYLTFEAHGRVVGEIARYLLFGVAMFLASWGFLAAIDGWSRARFVMAQIGFNVVLAAISFAVTRCFVFRQSAGV